MHACTHTLQGLPKSRSQTLLSPAGSGHKTRIAPGHAGTHGTNLEKQRQRRGRGEVTVSDYASTQIFRGW